MPTDRIQSPFTVGQIVNVPIVVTAIGGTTVEPTITGTTKYAGFNGSTDEIGPVDSIQVIEDK